MIRTRNKSTRPKVLLLPSSNLEMEKFSNENRDKMYKHIINCIEFAVDNSEDMVELFLFIGTQYYVILHDREFLQTLDHILAYYMENEMYENCQRIKTVKDKLILFYKNIKIDCLN